MAWHAEAEPFGDDRACWGALTEEDVAALFKGESDINASEIPITRDSSMIADRSSGQCLLHSPRGRRITVKVHQLDARFGGARDQWADEFLSARMTPLGRDVLGMASDTRAWGAVPYGCTGRPELDYGPLVVEMETGWTIYGEEVNTRDRDQLARSVVKLVNGYMRNEGCQGSVSAPVEEMSRPARFNDEESGAICGIKGLRSRSVGGAFPKRPLVTRGDGPVRTCDRDVMFGPSQPPPDDG